MIQPFNVNIFSLVKTGYMVSISYVFMLLLFGGVDVDTFIMFKSILRRYDYKIQYNDISKLFLLEKPDERYVAFVISLDKPIRQGQQKYQHLVLRTTKVRSLVIWHPRYIHGPLEGSFHHAVLSHMFHPGTPNGVVSTLQYFAHAGHRSRMVLCAVLSHAMRRDRHSMLLVRGTLETAVVVILSYTYPILTGRGHDHGQHVRGRFADQV